MEPNRPPRSINRRAMLTALALLPAFSGMVVPASVRAQIDPLPSWNDGATKQAIVEFVARVTRQGGPDFVPPAERIATFDNDGTLWAEQPMYCPARVRARPRQGAGAPASRMEGQAAVQGGDLKVT